MEMGFAEIRAKKGLMFGNGNDMENAVNWIMEHQEDAGIDEPIPEGDAAAAAAMDVDSGAAAGAGAYLGRRACGDVCLALLAFALLFLLCFALLALLQPPGCVDGAFVV